MIHSFKKLQEHKLPKTENYTWILNMLLLNLIL